VYVACLGKLGNAYRISDRNPERRNCFREGDVGGRIILKMIWKK
jgi:hypothetical protein